MFLWVFLTRMGNHFHANPQNPNGLSQFGSFWIDVRFGIRVRNGLILLIGTTNQNTGLPWRGLIEMWSDRSAKPGSNARIPEHPNGKMDSLSSLRWQSGPVEPVGLPPALLAWPRCPILSRLQKQIWRTWTIHSHDEYPKQRNGKRVSWPYENQSWRDWRCGTLDESCLAIPSDFPILQDTLLIAMAWSVLFGLDKSRMRA